MKRYLAGEKIKQSVIYVPTKLITQDNAKPVSGKARRPTLGPPRRQDP